MPPPASSAGLGAGSPSPAIGSVSQTGPPWRPAHTPGGRGGMVSISWLQACISEWGAAPCAPPPCSSEQQWQPKEQRTCRPGISRKALGLGGEQTPDPLLVWAWPLLLGGMRPAHREASAILWPSRPFPCWGSHLQPLRPQAQLDWAGSGGAGQF